MEIVGVGGMNRPSVEGVTANFPLRSDDPPDFFLPFPKQRACSQATQTRITIQPFCGPQRKRWSLASWCVTFLSVLVKSTVVSTVHMVLFCIIKILHLYRLRTDRNRKPRMKSLWHPPRVATYVQICTMDSTSLMRSAIST